jgi:uncharacterized membrane protein
VPETPEIRPEAPPWEILLSHHLPARYGRTFRLTFRHRSPLHLCARCTGQALGVATYLLILLLASARSESLLTPSVQLLFAAAPLPAALDWLSQSLQRRESTNRLRLVSGLFLGMAWTDLLALLVLERWQLFLGGVLVVALYGAVLALVLKLTGGWRGVIAEHFPGVEI